MFIRNYSDSLPGGNINFNVQFDDDLVTLLDVRPDLIAPVPTSNVVAIASPETLSSNGTYDFIADIEVEGRRFTLGLDSGVLVITPMMFIYPEYQPSVNATGYTVNAVSHEFDTSTQSLSMAYPDISKDYIATQDKPASLLAPADIDVANIQVVEYVNSPQLLGAFTRQGTSNKPKKLMYISVPLTAPTTLKGFFPSHIGPDNMEFRFKQGGAITSNIYIPMAF